MAWLRTESPIRPGERDYSLDSPAKAPEKSEGVFGWGKTPKYYSCYQAGSGTRHDFSSVYVGKEKQPAVISGYMGLIPGKHGGNIIGGTFNQTISDAENHLRRTVQATVLAGTTSGSSPTQTGEHPSSPTKAPSNSGSRPPSGTKNA